MPDENANNKIPPGFKLRHTLRGHVGATYRIAWSPNGRMIASGGHDEILRLWDAETGQLHRALKGRLSPIVGVAWSPDGRTIASANSDRTLCLWDTETGQGHHKFEGRSKRVTNVAWSPDGRMIASASDDGTIRLWDAETKLVRRMILEHPDQIFSLIWAPNGMMIASASDDRTVRLWDAETGRPYRTFKGSFTRVISVAWSPDSRTIASACDDGIVRLWDIATGQLLITLEGHTGIVKSVSFSFNGSLLASKSSDGTVRLWRCDIWENIAALNEPASMYWLPSLAFHPKAFVLATLGEEDTVIRIWDLDFDALLGTHSVPLSTSYTNAKVALVGDTGVGKTGLGVRLTEGMWRPTPGSTHGMKVWPLHSETEREVMLWDFAGQDEYRLVHQLFLNETNVALMLYDPTKSNDTFFGVDYWEKALRNAVPGEMIKILVAARVDVGGVRMTTADIEAYCKANGYLAHFATSAETNEGCDALRQAIMTAIPWERLSRTSSLEVFKRVKDFLAAVRQGNRVLVREHNLMAEFNVQADGDTATEAEFRKVLGHVETAGLIKCLSFGDLILLKPELLNGYASDVIDAARRHPDGLGAVSKTDVLEGRIAIREEGGLKASDKIFLLHATVELFLRLGLALEQNGNLVFPSKFNRKMPPLEEDPVVEVEFTFEGPVENLYTTLIVKLYYGGVFRLKKLWKNAAEFLNGRGHVCGFQLQNKGDGQGMLKVFYAEGVSDDDKALFLKIVADHFTEKRVEVCRERLYRCPNHECREPIRDRNAVYRAQQSGKSKIPCQYCFEPIPLIDAMEILYRDDEKFLSQIAAMESKAEASMERGGDLVAASAELRTENFKKWAGGADIATVAIVFTDVLDSTSLNVEMGYEPWRQVREAHFVHARELINKGRGYLIKTIGDSVMAAFHGAGDALDFALAFHRDTGHEAVKVRAGIHIGPVEVSPDDAFGHQVSMAARVEAKAKEGGIWTSAKVKEDVYTLRSAKHRHIKWTEHPDEEIKGFPGRFVLWSVEE